MITMERQYIVRTIIIALIVLVLILASGIAVGQSGESDNRTVPYEEWDDNVTHQNWTDDREDPTLSNATHYLTRVGTFVIGDDPNDPGVGPIFTGVLVGAFFMSVLGTSRSGVVASGTMGIMVIAALSTSTGAGLLPRWVYGVAILLIGMAAGIIYTRMIR